MTWHPDNITTCMLRPSGSSCVPYDQYVIVLEEESDTGFRGLDPTWGPLKRRGLLLSDLLSQYILKSGIQIHYWSKSLCSFYHSMYYLSGMEVVPGTQISWVQSPFYPQGGVCDIYVVGCRDSKLLTWPKVLS